MMDLISDFNSMAIPNPIQIQMMAIQILPGLGQANSGIGLGISKKLQFRSGIDPGSGRRPDLQQLFWLSRSHWLYDFNKYKIEIVEHSDTQES